MRLSAAVLLALISLFASPPAAHASDDVWAEVRTDIFRPDQTETDDGSVKVFGPKRAEDASLVPVSIYISAGLVPVAKRLVLVVDNNPAPIAATFLFWDAYRKGGDIGDRVIETRIRLDSLSAVRAVLETDDGRLFSGSQFIAGSGGCTSTSLKDLDEAMASLGRTRINVASDRTRGDLWREMQIQIRHPNFSGMQMDTRSGTYTPVHFVERIKVGIGGEAMVTIEGGIAISEDPHFRMSFAQSGSGTVNLVVQDSKGTVFNSEAAF